MKCRGNTEGTGTLAPLCLDLGLGCFPFPFSLCFSLLLSPLLKWMDKFSSFWFCIFYLSWPSIVWSGWVSVLSCCKSQGTVSTFIWKVWAVNYLPMSYGIFLHSRSLINTKLYKHAVASWRWQAAATHLQESAHVHALHSLTCSSAGWKPVLIPSSRISQRLCLLECCQACCLEQLLRSQIREIWFLQQSCSVWTRHDSLRPRWILWV